MRSAPEGHHRAPRQERADLLAASIRTEAGERLTIAEAFDRTRTDGVIVLHRGTVVMEEYRGFTGPSTRHLLNSATKSFVGTLAEDLVSRGALDRDQQVCHWLPELASTAYEDATLGHVLDMTISMTFDENYLDPQSEVFRYLTAMGMIPPSTDERGPAGVYDYLPSIRPAGEHGRSFAYREPNISVLGWIVRRATGRTLADVVSDELWQPLGAERDAYFLIDGLGAEGSLSATVSDFARFGELIRNRGAVGESQVLDPETVDRLFAGGDPAAFSRGTHAEMGDWSYVSQWWVRHLDGRRCLEARGFGGQFLYIDPAAEMVVAHVASPEVGPSVLHDRLMLPVLDHLAEHL